MLSWSTNVTSRHVVSGNIINNIDMWLHNSRIQTIQIFIQVQTFEL